MSYFKLNLNSLPGQRIIIITGMNDTASEAEFTVLLVRTIRSITSTKQSGTISQHRVTSVLGGNRTVVIEVLWKRWGKVRLLKKGDVVVE